MFQSLINLFFPKVCAGCESFLLQNENVICTSCRHEIPLTNHHKNTINEALNKFYGKVPVENALAFLYFHKKGIVQEMIHKLKYKGHQEIGNVIGEWCAEELKENSWLKTIDILVPVPLHSKKLRKRGYNQVSSFGKALSKVWNIPFDETILIRNVYSKTQTKKNLLGRTEVIQNIFDVNSLDKLHNLHFLLIDDVITTGSTLEACSRALLKIPNAKVSILCMAMTQ